MHFLATLTLFVHALWIVWMITGPFLIFLLRSPFPTTRGEGPGIGPGKARARKYLRAIYLLSVLGTLLFAFTSGVCPLTDVETYFRDKAGAQSYDTGFIEHYLSQFVYLGDNFETLAGLQMITLVLFAIAIYINFGRKLRF